MNKKLAEQLRELDKSKAALLKYIEGINEQKLLQQPDEKTWSVVQVISHLARVEEGTCKYLSKKLSFNPQLKRAGLKEKLKAWLATAGLRLPVKYKTYEILEENTNTVSLAQAVETWNQNRQQLASYLETLTADQLNAAIHKNFAAGKISIYQQLEFMNEHIQRHFRQIKTILQQLK